MKLSTIILALTTTDKMFKMTLNCIESLMDSEKEINMEIIVVESNKNYNDLPFKYPEFVKVIIPELDFNFHKFLNIGIKEAKGDFIALCNNDLLFHKNWFKEIEKIANEKSKVLSFSPGYHIKNQNNLNFELGYKVRTHIMGWCIVVRNNLFDKIGDLDDTFDFNYADNDYALTLKSKNIKHAVVFNSYVEHLERKMEAKETTKLTSYDLMIRKAELELSHIPNYIFTKEYEYLLLDKKGLSDNIKFHKKWGSPNLLYRKNKIADLLIRFHLGFLNQIFL